MPDSTGFRRLSAAAAFAATSIWLWILLLGDRLAWTTTEEFLRLHQDPLHLVRSVASMLSFVAALVAMAGLRDRIDGKDEGTARLALVAFAIGTAVDGLYRAVEAITVETVWAGKALAASDAAERAVFVSRIEAFRELGEGVFPVFGTFFVLAFLLFAVAARRLDRWLAGLLAGSGLAMATLYLVAFLSRPIPGPAWTLYELLMIALYVRLGVVLLQRGRDPR